RREGIRQGQDDRRPRRRERPGRIRRRGCEDIREPGCCEGLPGLVRRSGRAVDPPRARLPASGLVIESVSGGPKGGTGDVAGRARPATLRPGRWGERSVVALAALFALFLALPVVALVARALLDGSLRIALASPDVLRAL